MLLVLLVAAVLLVTTSDAVHAAFLDVLGVAERLMRTYPRAGMGIFLALAALSAMLSFFSSSALVPVGVYVWGPVPTLGLLWLGGTIGGIGGYWLARTLGRPLVRQLVPEAPFRRYETFFRTRARWRTVLLFRLALQSELPSYVLGVVRYPFARYLPMIVLGELPFVLFAVFLGETLLDRQGILFAGVLGLGLGFTVLAFRHLQREMREG